MNSVLNTPVETSNGKRAILLIDAGYFLTREVGRALQEEGHTVIVVPMQMDTNSPISDQSIYSRFLNNIVNAVEGTNPDYLLTINHLGFDSEGRLTDLLETLALPALSWYVDSPRYILLDNASNVSDNMGIFLWDEGYTDWMTSRGFGKIQWLPLATDPQIFYTEADPFVIDSSSKDSLIFVGDSMTSAVERAFRKLPQSILPASDDGKDDDFQRFITHFCEIVRTGSGKRGEPIWNTYQQIVNGDRPDGMSSMGVDLYSMPDSIPRQFDSVNSLNLESALVLLATKQHRLSMMKMIAERIQPESLLIYGDDEWKSKLNGCTRILPSLHYYNELTTVYSQADAVINVTGYQMPQAINQRCFDVPASGGFILTDRQPDVEKLFDPETEITTFASTEELLDKWRFFRSHPEQKKAVVTRGRERILAEHTYRHRIRKMMAVADRWFL